MVEELFDTENQIVQIVLTAIILLLLMLIATILFFYFSRRRIIIAQLEKANLELSHQKEILQATIVTQEEERKRIAQNLHDAISSKLNIVFLNGNCLLEENIGLEETHKMATNIINVTSSILESSRRIAHDLLPPTLQKFGLKVALEELYEELSELHRFEINYKVHYTENFLKSNDELHLFRIVQELVNNSIKHANASSLFLSLTTFDTNLSLTYEDDGRGFMIDKTAGTKGLGIRGIEHRVEMLKGKLRINSDMKKGMRAIITIEQ